MSHLPAVPDELSQPGLAGRRLGRYEVLTQLASGGMGGVYVGRAIGVAGFERLVAVKVLHPHLAHEEEFISMFLDEARLAARIRHPNVVATLDISDTEGAGFFIVMDYIDGDHLGALLRGAARSRSRLPVPVVVRIVLDALSGLNAAHKLNDEKGDRLNLVHRDVSPHNILVGSDGSARLTDFGVAKAEVRLSSTREGQFKGKLGYMAPEHASSGEADQRSDLFSMGIILWESLAGKRLFRGENNAATLNKILNDPIPAIATVDEDLAVFDPVLARALARPTADRFQSAEEFMEALEDAARGSRFVGSTRAVANVVKHYAGDKLAEEKSRIREAIDTLGRAELGTAPLPLPGDGSSSRSFRVEAAGNEDATMGAIPSQLYDGPRRPRKVMWIAIAVLVLVFAAGGVAVAMMMGPGEDTVATSPQAETPTEPATTEPSEPSEAPTPAAETAAAAADSVDDSEPPSEAEGETPVAETAETDPAAEAARLRRLRERRRRLREQRQKQQQMMTPMMGGGEEELIDNPYRR